jgi:hypothetical protein
VTTAVKTPPTPKPADKVGPFALGRRVIADWNNEVSTQLGLTWDQHCQNSHGWLRAMGQTGQLPVPARRSLVKAMRLARMSESAIASALGVAKSTVHADRAAINDPDEPARIYGVDGASRPGGRAGTRVREVTRPTVEVETEILTQAATGLNNRDYVVYLVAEYAPRGLTARELDELVDWHRSNLAGTLSHVERQHRLRRDGLRGGMGVYVLGENPRVPTPSRQQDQQTPE